MKNSRTEIWHKEYTCLTNLVFYHLSPKLYNFLVTSSSINLENMVTKGTLLLKFFSNTPSHRIAEHVFYFRICPGTQFPPFLPHVPLVFIPRLHCELISSPMQCSLGKMPCHLFLHKPLKTVEKALLGSQEFCHAIQDWMIEGTQEEICCSSF